MSEELYVKVCDITDIVYDFNNYKYRLVTCAAKTDDPFDTLIPIEQEIVPGGVINIEKCRLVRIDYDADYTRVALRVDKLTLCPDSQPISRYFNIPFIGMIKKQSEAHPMTYGPDKTKFFRVQLQMRDPDKKTFIVYLLGFNNKATLLDEFEKFDIITGYATLKHKNGSERYELALCEAELYQK